LPIARPPALVEDRAEAGEEIQTLHRFVDLLSVGLIGVLKHLHPLPRGNDHSVDRRVPVLKIRLLSKQRLDGLAPGVLGLAVDDHPEVPHLCRADACILRVQGERPLALIGPCVGIRIVEGATELDVGPHRRPLPLALDVRLVRGDEYGDDADDDRAETDDRFGAGQPGEE
jgi:hypothetical protein